MRSLPVYLTEADQNDSWRNENVQWVQRAYGEIDWWNRQPGNQVIRAVILYRWPNVDRWGIDGKAGVIEDFRQAKTYRNGKMSVHKSNGMDKGHQAEIASTGWLPPLGPSASA